MTRTLLSLSDVWPTSLFFVLATKSYWYSPAYPICVSGDEPIEVNTVVVELHACRKSIESMAM